MASEARAADGRPQPDEQQRQSNNSSGQRNRSSERQGRNNRGRRGNKQRAPVFKGDHPDLQGIVFTVEGGASQYDESKRRVLEHLLAEGKIRNGKDIRAAAQTLTAPNFANWAPPALNPAVAGDQVQQDLQRERVKGAYRREVDYGDNSTALFSLVLGQCSLELRDKLYSLADWDAMNTDTDAIALLTAIRTIMHNRQADQYPYLSAFAHVVAQLLFLSQRARPDLKLAVAFLTTRMQAPDADDVKKLSRALSYLNSTRRLPLTLEVTNLHVAKWWVDASHAVHPDCRGHSGGLLSYGKGAVISGSFKHKINSRSASASESELITLDDFMPQILWTQNFMEAQGHQVEPAVTFQDNQSTMLLAKNGRASSSKRTKHINIRYFFVTSQIAANKIRLQYLPTGEMIADFFTKPLQGSLFRKFRKLILNLQDDN